MSNAEVSGYATKWLTLDTMCMSVPFFSDTCHGMETTRWKKDGSDYETVINGLPVEKTQTINGQWYW